MNKKVDKRLWLECLLTIDGVSVNFPPQNIILFNLIHFWESSLYRTRLSLVGRNPFAQNYIYAACRTSIYVIFYSPESSPQKAEQMELFYFFFATSPMCSSNKPHYLSSSFEAYASAARHTSHNVFAALMAAASKICLQSFYLLQLFKSALFKGCCQPTVMQHEYESLLW